MRSGLSLIATLACCAIFILILSSSLVLTQSSDPQRSVKAVAMNLQASSGSSDKLLTTSVKHEITIRMPSGPPQVDTGITNMHGQKLYVACSTCHASREPNITNRSTSDLDEFHKDMRFSHGNLTCLACHNPNDYDTLHLADRSKLAFQEVMSLCSQCHGTQRRDYDHGAHGGMTGYWDLKRGPRVRNNCVDCHSPHQPKFPKMNPTFKPRDRFLESHSGEQHE